MKKVIKILLIVLLFLMLISVRAFIQPFFYDPLIAYFKSDYLYTSIPEINFYKFSLNLFIRYSLNTIISLAIIYILFPASKVLKFSVKFYIVSFVILSIVLLTLLKFNQNQDFRLIFYVRRFLIHPLFLLILLPAFYYQKLKLDK